MNERVCISYFAYYYYYYYSPRFNIGDLSQCWLFFLMPFGIPPPKDLNSRKLDIKVLKRVIDFCLFFCVFQIRAVLRMLYILFFIIFYKRKTHSSKSQNLNYQRNPPTPNPGLSTPYIVDNLVFSVFR